MNFHSCSKAATPERTEQAVAEMRRAGHGAALIEYHCKLAWLSLDPFLPEITSLHYSN